MWCDVDLACYGDLFQCYPPAPGPEPSAQHVRGFVFVFPLPPRRDKLTINTRPQMGGEMSDPLLSPPGANAYVGSLNPNSPCFHRFVARETSMKSNLSPELLREINIFHPVSGGTGYWTSVSDFTSMHGTRAWEGDSKITRISRLSPTTGHQSRTGAPPCIRWDLCLLITC